MNIQHDLIWLLKIIICFINEIVSYDKVNKNDTQIYKYNFDSTSLWKSI